MTDNLALFCPKDHAFASKKSVSLANLQGQHFVQFGEESPTRKATDALLAEQGVAVNVRMECDNIEILKQMIEVGFGVGLLPEKALTNADEAAGLVAVPIKDAKIERPISLLLLKNAPRFKAMRAFVTTLLGKGKKDGDDDDE
jgi:DNA-binding transcriptional LysR family regulator